MIATCLFPVICPIPGLDATKKCGQMCKPNYGTRNRPIDENSDSDLISGRVKIQGIE